MHLSRLLLLLVSALQSQSTEREEATSNSLRILESESEISYLSNLTEISLEDLQQRMAGKSDLNRAHFDEQASTYNTRWQKTIDQLILEIQKKKEWIGVDWVGDDDDESGDRKVKEDSSKTNEKKSVRLLDYACGTGLVSRALLPSITSSTGIDVSPNMVNEFNKLASNQGLSPAEMHAYVGNLVSPSPNPTFSSPEFYDFDIAVVGLGFHHFDDPALAAKRLVERLKVGGVLVIVDFLPHGPWEGGEGHGHSHGHSHGHHPHTHDKGKGEPQESDSDVAKSAQHTVTHHGFAIKDVKKIFEDAGAGKDFEAKELGKGVVFSKTDGEKLDFKREVFIARGFKL